MLLFLFSFTIALLPHFSTSNSFLQFGSHEYYIERNNPVWNYLEAEEKCNALQGTLAIVNTKDINDFLVEKIGVLTAAPHSFYVGLRRIRRDKYAFVWIDGSPLEYSNWYKGEPNNSGNAVNGSYYEGCVTVRMRYFTDRGLQWSDAPCINRESLFICQRAIKSRISKRAIAKSSSTTASKSPAAICNLAVTFGILILVLVVLVIVLLFYIRILKFNFKDLQAKFTQLLDSAATTKASDISAETTTEAAKSAKITESRNAAAGAAATTTANTAVATTTLAAKTNGPKPYSVKENHNYEEIEPQFLRESKASGYLKMKPINQDMKPFYNRSNSKLINKDIGN